MFLEYLKLRKYMMQQNIILHIKYNKQDYMFAYVRKLDYNTDNYGQIYFKHFVVINFLKSLELIDAQDFLT